MLSAKEFRGRPWTATIGSIGATGGVLEKNPPIPYSYLPILFGLSHGLDLYGMRIHLFTFKQEEGLCYRAYASTDPDRSEADTHTDIFWHLGLQYDHPTYDMETLDVHDLGRNTLLERTTCRETYLTLEECGGWVRLALDASGYVSASYPVLAEQGAEPADMAEGYYYYMVPFYPIMPLATCAQTDSDASDDDSDDDSD